MKKLNKKGVTLIELIVSFAIVSVALIYFYQTIVDLHRMYKNSNKATDEFVNKDYALRVLDAWATKSDNNLSDLLSTASSPVKICYMYNMACDDNETKYENDGEFKKITLIDSSNNVLAVYYKYEKTLVDLKLESAGALDEYGNVNSYDNMSKTLKEADDDIVTVGFDNGIIKYEITDKYGKERYTKTNTNTINKLIENNVTDKTETNINAEVKKLMGPNYNIIESIEIVKEDSDESKKEYARVYNVVDIKGNTIAKNIYQIDTNMTKLTSFMLKNQFEDIAKDFFDKEIEADGQEYHIENIGSYYMIFNVSSTSTDENCALFLKPEKEYRFGWNSNSISKTYVQNLKDIGVKHIKNDDGSYNISFLKFEPKDTNAYIKHYTWNKEANCKAKLVEAYKYK